MGKQNYLSFIRDKIKQTNVKIILDRILGKIMLAKKLKWLNEMSFFSKDFPHFAGFFTFNDNLLSSSHSNLQWKLKKVRVIEILKQRLEVRK